MKITTPLLRLTPISIIGFTLIFVGLLAIFTGVIGTPKSGLHELATKNHELKTQILMYKTKLAEEKARGYNEAISLAIKALHNNPECFKELTKGERQSGS